MKKKLGYVSQETLDSQKLRWWYLKQEKFPEVDAEMIPLLHYFNIHPNVTTMYCCSGHPEKPTEYENDARIANVVIMSTISGVSWLKNFWYTLVTRCSNKDMGHLVYEEKIMGYFKRDSTPVEYPGVVISIKYKTRDELMYYLQIMIDTFHDLGVYIQTPNEETSR